MSWIKAPKSKVLHIYKRSGAMNGERWLDALCGYRLMHPNPFPFFTAERAEGERVCGHCARLARREALVLLAHAEGRAATDPTIRKRVER